VCNVERVEVGSSGEHLEHQLRCMHTHTHTHTHISSAATSSLKSDLYMYCQIYVYMYICIYMYVCSMYI
jgi:hypothetical protein